MTFPQDGYLLAAADGDAWWFLDERMTVKVSGREIGWRLYAHRMVRPARLRAAEARSRA